MQVRSSDVTWGSNYRRLQYLDSAGHSLCEVHLVPKDRVRAFREALCYGTIADWTLFLAGLRSQDRLPLLTTFIIADLVRRWDRGERPLVESYTRKFPEFGPMSAVPVALIIGEYHCRKNAGDPVGLAEYRDRFPTQYVAVLAELGLEGVGWSAPERTAPAMPLLANDVLPDALQYDLVRELGRGMFGEVWLARKRPSDIEKAIKIILRASDPTQRELRALELVKNLRHPYLLSTEDFWLTSNRLYIVTELADHTIRHQLKQYRDQGQPGIPRDELLRYAAETAEALDYLHARYITHRDVKADNILLLCGHVKVADLGLAYLQEASIGTMSCAGTPSHMAPELWGGNGGPASDQYSLAITYTEMRQGQPTLRARTLMELMTAHGEGRHEFTEVIREQERAVLRRALDPVPDHRYPTCGHFVEALRIASA